MQIEESQAEFVGGDRSISPVAAISQRRGSEQFSPPEAKNSFVQQGEEDMRDYDVPSSHEGALVAPEPVFGANTKPRLKEKPSGVTFAAELAETSGEAPQLPSPRISAAKRRWWNAYRYVCEQSGLKVSVEQFKQTKYIQK